MWDTAAKKPKTFKNKEEAKNFVELRKSVDHKKLLQLNLTIDFGKDFEGKVKDFESRASSPKPLATTRLTTQKKSMSVKKEKRGPQTSRASFHKSMFI